MCIYTLSYSYIHTYKYIYRYIIYSPLYIVKLVIYLYIPSTYKAYPFNLIAITACYFIDIDMRTKKKLITIPVAFRLMWMHEDKNKLKLASHYIYWMLYIHLIAFTFLFIAHIQQRNTQINHAWHKILQMDGCVLYNGYARAQLHMHIAQMQNLCAYKKIFYDRAFTCMGTFMCAHHARTASLNWKKAKLNACAFVLTTGSIKSCAEVRWRFTARQYRAQAPFLYTDTLRRRRRQYTHNNETFSNVHSRETYITIRHSFSHSQPFLLEVHYQTYMYIVHSRCIICSNVWCKAKYMEYKCT